MCEQGGFFCWRIKMPYDSEGIYTRYHNWEEYRENDIDIVTDHADEEDDGFASALSLAFLRDGRVPMEGPIDMANYKVKNLADGSDDGDAVNHKQLVAASEQIDKDVQDVEDKFKPVDSLPEETEAEAFYFVFE